MLIKDSDTTINYTAGMELLVNTVQELSLARNMETVTAIVRTAARRLTGADGATFVLKDNGYCYYADEDAIEPLWKGHRFPLESCVSGWAMLNKKAAVIPDIYQDVRIPAEAYRPTFVKSLVMVPIRTLNPIGAIGNYWANTHHATKEEVQILQSLADITAVTLENVQVYAELEERVKSRTAELEIANQQLEAFTYSVSHDLRAPLNNIQGLAGILQQSQETSLDEEGKELTALIVQCAQNMTSLVDDLLLFFTLPKRKLQHRKVSMKKMAADCFAVLRDQEDTKRNFEFSIADLPDVNIDASMMKHVWSNLLSNAIKYSRKKDKTVITIGYEETPLDITYFVRDQGSGFDMTSYDKLFGVFQRLHSDEEFEGNGIGLSLVERIISRYNGKIRAEGKPGKGATFYFTLPKNDNGHTGGEQ